MIIFGSIVIAVVFIECTLLVRLSRQVPAYGTYWQQRADEPVSPAENMLTYVALGDSAAQGVGASQPQRGYVGLLEEALAARTGKSVQVINLSRSGARIRDVFDDQLPRLAALDLPGDVVITLDIGSNDLKSYDKTSFQEDFAGLLEALPRQTVVADIPYFGPYALARGREHVVPANQIIRSLAAQYSMKYAPVYEHTVSHKGPHYYAADLFHPNDRGYRSWFDAFWEVL